jgi:hypothetical protein
MPEAIKNGTPLPIVLNILDKVIVCGSSNLLGKEQLCISLAKLLVRIKL